VTVFSQFIQHLCIPWGFRS